MKMLIAALAMTLLLGLGAMGCESTTSTSTADAGHNCAMCEKGAAGETVWCSHCEHGFVDGKMTECPGCVTAAKSGGECPACTKG